MNHYLHTPFRISKNLFDSFNTDKKNVVKWEHDEVIYKMQQFIDSHATMVDLILRFFGVGNNLKASYCNINYKYGNLCVSTKYSITLLSRLYFYLKYPKVRKYIESNLYNSSMSLESNKDFFITKCFDSCSIDDTVASTSYIPSKEIYNADMTITVLKIIMDYNPSILATFTSKEMYMLSVYPIYHNNLSDEDLSSLASDGFNNYIFTYKPMLMLYIDKFLSFEPTEKKEEYDASVSRIASLIFQL